MGKTATPSAKLRWQREAAAVVCKLARTGLIFTSNDVWRMGVSTPADRRWLGPVMRRLAAEGVIVRAGHYAPSFFGHGATNNAYWKGVA